jgi:hypothetical protein
MNDFLKQIQKARDQARKDPYFCKELVYEADFQNGQRGVAKITITSRGEIGSYSLCRGGQN